MFGQLEFHETIGQPILVRIECESSEHTRRLRQDEQENQQFLEFFGQENKKFTQSPHRAHAVAAHVVVRHFHIAILLILYHVSKQTGRQALQTPRHQQLHSAQTLVALVQFYHLLYVVVDHQAAAEGDDQRGEATRLYSLFQGVVLLHCLYISIEFEAVQAKVAEEVVKRLQRPVEATQSPTKQQKGQ